MSKKPASSLRIALAQLNPTVGDLDGNAALARKARAEAARLGADLLVLSELFLTGYPPEDLVLKPAFRAEARRVAGSSPSKRPMVGRRSSSAMSGKPTARSTTPCC